MGSFLEICLVIILPLVFFVLFIGSSIVKITAKTKNMLTILATALFTVGLFFIVLGWLEPVVLLGIFNLKDDFLFRLGRLILAFSFPLWFAGGKKLQAINLLDYIYKKR